MLLYKRKSNCICWLVIFAIGNYATDTLIEGALELKQYVKQYFKSKKQMLEADNFTLKDVNNN